MTSADVRIDAALHSLGQRGDQVMVVSLGRAEGIAQRTRGYVQRYGWREVAIGFVALEESLDSHLEAQGIDQIDVLHIETKWNDWKILKQVDLVRFRPRVIRLRRAYLRGADLFSAIRFLNRRGYDIEWFYDELVGLAQSETEAAVERRSPPAAGENAAKVAAAARVGDPAALYVISYNFPEQFRLWLESVERANPALLASPARFLLDNSSDRSTRTGYDQLSERYGFAVLRHGNLGITGGRVFCAKQFDSLPQLEGLYWFEDDMLLCPPDAPACRNGLRTHVPGLDQIAPAIVRREGLDFLKLSFTEFFGDHHLNWAWYHLSREMREIGFPDGTFRTHIQHSGVEGGISYIVGNVHYDNWPTYMTRRGNAEMFLRVAIRDSSEGVYMARGFELQYRGEMRGGALLASPVCHSRAYFYPREERVES